ncbi:MAG: DUF3611 family protein [Rhodobacteraceae bacterium]|nr:DUF3611 family protein [Paracoccaceae bacterium]
MTTASTWIESRRPGVATALQQFGMLGFWVQLVFLIIVALLGGYTFSVTGGTNSRAGLANLLSFLVLAIPVFTTFWCRRYASTGKSMAAGSDGPTPAGLKRRLWTGTWAGIIGAVASLLSLFGAASALLFTMLANPQIGIQVSPGPGTPSSYTISAIDGVSIMSLLLTLTAELLVVAISLRLIFLTERASTRNTPA